MTSTTTERVEVTVRYGVTQVVRQLREFAASAQPGRNEQVAARDLAGQLEAADDAAAVAILRRESNRIANMGIGRAGVSTNWAHVAVMIGFPAGGTRYVLDGGVLYQCVRPSGPEMTWDADAGTWRHGSSDWQWDAVACRWAVAR